MDDPLGGEFEEAPPGWRFLTTDETWDTDYLRSLVGRLVAFWVGDRTSGKWVLATMDMVIIEDDGDVAFRATHRSGGGISVGRTSDSCWNWNLLAVPAAVVTPAPERNYPQPSEKGIIAYPAAAAETPVDPNELVMSKEEAFFVLISVLFNLSTNDPARFEGFVIRLIQLSPHFRVIMTNGGSITDPNWVQRVTSALAVDVFQFRRVLAELDSRSLRTAPGGRTRSPGVLMDKKQTDEWFKNLQRRAAKLAKNPEKLAEWPEDLKVALEVMRRIDEIIRKNPPQAAAAAAATPRVRLTPAQMATKTAAIRIRDLNALYGGQRRHQEDGGQRRQDEDEEERGRRDDQRDDDGDEEERGLDDDHDGDDRLRDDNGYVLGPDDDELDDDHINRLQVGVEYQTPRQPVGVGKKRMREEVEPGQRKRKDLELARRGKKIFEQQQRKQQQLQERQQRRQQELQERKRQRQQRKHGGT